MNEKIEVEEKWDFYPCRVDDHPASMSLNMAFIQLAPVSHAGTVYWLAFEIPDPGEHGMGTGDCIDTIFDVEDLVIDRLNNTTLHYVGRLRNMGKWELYFYGPEGLDATIDAAAAKATSEIAQLAYDFGSKPDPDWSCYVDFIYPTPERHRWMMDRSVVDQCAKHGDLHDKPRRIDHWIYFAEKENREAMAKACAEIGFARENDPENGQGDRRFGLQLYREDPSELGHINSVTSRLCELAAEHNGDYDGWETFIVKE